MKKGQVTIFIIILILILAMVVFVYLFSTGKINRGRIPSQYSHIDSMFEDCLQARAIDAVWLVGLNGGYINGDYDYIENPFGNTAYGLKDKRNVLVEKDVVEKEIQDYLVFSLSYCTDAVNNEDIKTEKPMAEVKIFDNEIEVKGYIDYIITGDKATETYEREYEVDLPIRLGEILTSANLIVEQQIKAKNKIPLEFVSNFDGDIMFEYIDEEKVLYIIHDEKSKIDDLSYSFLFVAEIEQGEIE
tara:strand:+ start:789 stop:1523 length:735 start_codon:yes stop_codon:yes gene_type:complete